MILGTTTFLLSTQKAMASTTSVSTNISVHQNTSNNVTSVTQTNGKSKVVVNGQEIKPDENGNVNYESEDGTTKVHISNSNADTTITPPARPTLSPEAKEKVNEIKKDNAKKKEEIKKKLEEQKKEIKEKLNDKTFNLREFFEKEFPLLKKLFSALPLV